MFELSIILGLVIAAVIYFKIIKKNAQIEVAQQPIVTSAPVNPVIDDIVVDKAVETASAADEAVATIVPELISDIVLDAPQPVLSPAATIEKAVGSSWLPQDSVLKRHFLAQVQAYVEELLPGQPSDSVLKRHYNSVLTSQLAHALSSQDAFDEMVEKYRFSKQVSPVVQNADVLNVVEPKTLTEIDRVVEPVRPKLPEDSILRRHYITQLRSLIEADLPEKPTDSVLKRHWQALSDKALNNQL